MGIGSNLQEKDPFRSLQILEELSKSGSLTQRDISKRLGLALGLVNSYIRNLISKGYITEVLAKLFVIPEFLYRGYAFSST